MGYVKIPLPGGKEQIVDASKVLAVRSNASGNLDLIIGFHTISTSSSPHEPTPNLPIQFRIKGSGFDNATIARMNTAIINAQVNLFTDFELADGEVINEFLLDPFPL